VISEISILSRFEMVKIIHGIDQPPKKPFLVISCFGNRVHMLINNAGEHTPNVLIQGQKINRLKSLGMVDFVNVFCDDVTPEQVEELNSKNPGKYLIKLFNENDAKDVIKFIDRYKDEDCILIVHCDAGISRSSAVSKYSAYVLGFGAEYFDKKYPYICPNQHIIKILFETSNIEYEKYLKYEINKV